MDGPTPATPPPADAPQRAVAPCPPRYGWTKRLALVGLLLAVAFAAAWGGWRHVARQRLARALAALDARGESPRFADYAAPPLADGENAAFYFRRAIAAIKPGVDSPASSALEYPDYPPFPPEWHRLADGNVAAHGQVFAWERQARAHPRADWGIRADTTWLNDYSPLLNRMRHLANLTGDAALQQHLGGDDAAGLELLRDGRHLARCVDQHPLLVSHLVAVGIDSMMLYRLLMVTSALTIAPADDSTAVAKPGAGALLPATRPSARGASRAQVRALVAELLADGAPTEPLRRCFLGDRAMIFALFQDVGRDAPLVAPMFDLDTARVAARQPEVVRATTQPTWPGVQAVLLSQSPAPPVRPRPPPRAKPPTPLHREAADFPHALNDAYVSPGLWMVIRSDMQVRSERRKAAVALAVQLYRADHGGAWPASVAQLVPNYLPAAPTDPYAADGRAIGYRVVPQGRPDGADRPVVYDVSEDGKDQIATNPAKWLTPEPNFSSVRGAADQWRDLTCWVPPAAETLPATTQSTN